MKFDLVIKNGVICTSSGMKRANLAIKDGIIQAHLPYGAEYEADKEYDAKGKILFPGTVDTHVHFAQGNMTPEGWHDDAISESRAAIQGGCTSIMTTTFGGDKPLPYYYDACVGACDQDKLYANVKVTIPLGNYEQFDDIKPMFDRGVSAFKFYLGYRGEVARTYNMPSGDIDTAMMHEGFKKIAECGAPAFAMVHCEDSDLKELYGADIPEPEDGNYLKQMPEIQPTVCEVVDLCKAAYVADKVKCPLYVVHISGKETVDQLRFLKENGYDVTGETCIHYLMYTCDDDCFVGNDDKTRMARVNPPIRHQADQDAIWAGIREGVISCLGTDSVNYKPELKFGQHWWESMCGCGFGSGLYLPLMLSEGVNKNKITLDTLRKIMCENPAKRFGIYPQKGNLEIGADADVVIIDLDKEIAIDDIDYESKNCFNLYEGWKCKGAPIATFVNGNLAVEDYKIVSEEAYGKLLKSSSQGKLL